MQPRNVQPDAVSGTRPAGWRPLVATLASGVLGLTLTALAWVNTEKAIHDKAQADFDQTVERLTADIKDRFERPLYGLRGLAGAWKSASGTGGLRDHQFQAYLATHHLAAEFPGVHGFSFVEHLPRQQLARFEAARRAEGEPDFSVRSSAHREDLYVVKYISPLEKNRPALGLDIGSDPVKLGAIENAIASGEPTLSGKVTLIQDPTHSPGFLYLLPLFEDAPRSGLASTRKPRVIGLFSAPMLVSNLLVNTHPLVQGDVEFELFDGTEVSAASLVFSDAIRPAAAPDQTSPIDFAGQRVFSDSKNLLVGNSVLTLKIGSSAALEARMDYTKPLLVGLGGTLLSLLVSAVIWLLWMGRARAELKAGRMTKDLERLATEERRASLLLQGAIAALDEAFVVYGPDDRLVLCNDKFRQTLPELADMMVPGTLFEDTIRTGAQRGLFKDKVGTIDDWVAQRMATHRAANSTVLQHLDDGRVIRIVERRLPDGHTVGFRIDVTEIVRATEAAEEASKSKSQFLANMSHEIRTPMNAILGMLKLTEMTHLSPQQHDYISKSQSAAMSLLRLINDILDFSKIDAGKLELDIHPFRIDRLLRDLAVILSANANSKLIEILFDIDPELPEVVQGDALRLQQVLINLGGNAVKFTAQGQVVISLRKVVSPDEAADTMGIEFSVTDSGIGIAAEHCTRIFSGFTQAEGSTTRKYGGTGLGLVISKRLIEAMGGNLSLASEVGQGTRFFFTLNLPVAKVVPAELARTHRPVPSKYRLLIVDDNTVACDLMRGMTRNWSASCDVAHSGEEALTLLRNAQHEPQPPYEVIYLDCQMPGIDGWETARQIRQMGLTSTAPKPIIIMVTANGREVLTARTQEEQHMLNGFLVKPITASMLLDAVLDAQSAVPRVRQASRSDANKRGLVGMRLLVVEDNLINQQVAEELLVAQGAYVALAANGQLGVEAVQAANPPFDAVLMDIQMPVMDGFAATQAIRHTLGMKDLPIIGLTANAMATDRTACLQSGMNEHVGKPFSLPQLVSLLIRLTARPGATSTPPTA